MLEGHPNDTQILPLGYLLSGRYSLDTFLGSGGMGAVYLASDKLLEDKPVAIKILHKEFSRDSELTRRFLREVNMMHSVNHPNVVRTYDAGVQDGMFYFTMEYIEGLLLDQYLESLGRDYALLGKITAQICKGLEAIHSQNIVHRDLKPGNILVSNEGVVKITDFGVARPVSSGHTAHREIMGSLDYIPPEVFQGQQITPASDFYSLGVILYGIVCGVFPFDAEDPMAIVWKHVHEVPALPSAHNPEVPSWMDRLIMRLLEKDPAKRPQAAREIIRFVRQNIIKDSQLLDSGAHPVSKSKIAEAEHKSYSDTDIFEMEINPKDLEPDPSGLSHFQESDSIRIDSFTSACNQVIFDALPTVDQIRNHEKIWEERKRKRGEGHDLKGLAAKVKQAEKYDEIKRIRIAIQITAFIVVASLVLAFISSYGDKNIDAKEQEKIENKKVSILELKKDYLSGNADVIRTNSSKSSDPSTELSWKKSYLDNKDQGSLTDKLQGLSFNRLKSLRRNIDYLAGSTPPPADENNSADLWGQGAKTNAFGASASMQLLEKRTVEGRQEMRKYVESQPAIATSYQGYQVESQKNEELSSQLQAPSQDQREVYIEKRKLRDNLTNIQGQLDAYQIADESDLSRKEVEADAEIEKIKKFQSTLDTHLSSQIEKQSILSALIRDLDKGGHIKVAREFAKIDIDVKQRLAHYDQVEQAYTEMTDSIKEGKLSVDKIAIAEASKELEIQRDELNKTLKKKMSEGINNSFKELFDSSVLADINKERQASIDIEKEARRSYWHKIKEGQADDRKVLEEQKVQLENRLNEIEKILPQQQETSIRGLVAVESFGADSK